jgi:hypothetical protein
MRNPKAFATWLAAALLLLHCTPASAQADAFRFQADRVPVGQVLDYRKSQLDGRHEARISIYMASVDRIESLKWDEGGDRATLVVALMDWSTFSVRRFESWQLSRGSAPQLRATMDVSGNELRASFLEKPLTLNHVPWHSFDFDFTSLNLSLPHRRDPRGKFSFWRTDFVYGDSPAMAELGEVHLEFQARDKRHGRPAWRYSLAGEGLAGHRGSWWVDRRNGLTLEFELPVGDEPGYDSVRLRLERIRDMAAAEWQAFKQAAVSGS